MDWRSHYNRSDNRCYVELSFFDGLAQRDANKGVTVGPSSFREIYDPVERVQVAGFAESGPKVDPLIRAGYCQVATPIGAQVITEVDCPVALKFITERMSN